MAIAISVFVGMVIGGTLAFFAFCIFALNRHNDFVTEIRRLKILAGENPCE